MEKRCSYRYNQQFNGSSFKYRMFLDNRKKIPTTNSATQGEPFRHIRQIWETCRFTKNIKTAVQSRATIAHQGQRHAQIRPQEKTRQRPLICNCAFNFETNASHGVISVQHRRRRQRHGGIRNNGKIPNSGEDGNKKNGNISNGGRNGKYSRSESFARILHIRSVFESFRLQTLANVVHATEG